MLFAHIQARIVHKKQSKHGKTNAWLVCAFAFTVCFTYIHILYMCVCVCVCVCACVCVCVSPRKPAKAMSL